MINGTRPVDPWAAVASGCEEDGLMAGTSRDGVIFAAMEIYIDSLWVIESEEVTTEVTVYYGPVPCDGILGHDGCVECGDGHQDTEWTLVGWHRREVVTVRVWMDDGGGGHVGWEVVDAPR